MRYSFGFVHTPFRTPLLSVPGTGSRSDSRVGHRSWRTVGVLTPVSSRVGRGVLRLLYGTVGCLDTLLLTKNNTSVIPKPPKDVSLSFWVCDRVSQYSSWVFLLSVHMFRVTDHISFWGIYVDNKRDTSKLVVSFDTLSLGITTGICLRLSIVRTMTRQIFSERVCNRYSTVVLGAFVIPGTGSNVSRIHRLDLSLCVEVSGSYHSHLGFVTEYPVLLTRTYFTLSCLWIDEGSFRLNPNAGWIH